MLTKELTLSSEYLTPLLDIGQRSIWQYFWDLISVCHSLDLDYDSLLYVIKLHPSTTSETLNKLEQNRFLMQGIINTPYTDIVQFFHIHYTKIDNEMKAIRFYPDGYLINPSTGTEPFVNSQGNRLSEKIRLGNKIK